MRWHRVSGLAAALLVAGCAAQRPTAEWVKTRDSADDFERAREACTNRAMAATGTSTYNSQATQAALGVYLKCMEEKGWVTSERPAPKEP